MRKKIFFILFLFLLQSLSYAQIYRVKGQILDSITNEPLAFVNIIINDTKQGGMSNIEGNFDLSLSQPIEYLQMSYVGYYSDTFFVKQNNSLSLKIELVPSTYQLREFVLLPGINPAHRIIQNAIDNRKNNHPQKQGSFRYVSYNKMILTVDVDTLKSKDPSELDSSDIHLLDFFEEHHLFFMESINERIFMPPDRSNEKILASKVSGFSDPLFSLLMTQVQPFSFYDDIIIISDKKYVNPISPGATDKYFYTIEDTLYQGIDSVFIISYRPWKGTSFDGLTGLLYINTNGWAIQNVIAEPWDIDEQGIGMKIQQLYEFVDGKQWFPVELNTFFFFKTVKVNDSYMLGISNTYIKEIELDADLKKRNFSFAEIEVDENAINADKELWQKYRVDSLTEKELNTYHLIDSIGEAENLDRRMETLRILMTGKLPWKWINIDLDKIMDYNDFEGYQLGLGIHTSSRFSKHFSIGGYANWGFKDKAWKYGGDVEFMLWRARELKWRTEYSFDVTEPGVHYFHDINSSLKIANEEYYRSFLVDQMDEVLHMGTGFEMLLSRNLRGSIFIDSYHKKPLYDYQYIIAQSNNATATQSEFDFTEISFGLKYAHNEKMFYNIDYNLNMNINSNRPIIWFNYSRGVADLLHGDFDYNRFDIKVKQRINYKYLGQTKLMLTAGYVDKDLPYTQMYKASSSFRQFTISTPMSFSTMRMNEFIADSYVSLFFSHGFESPFSREKKFRPELEIHTNVCFGDLRKPELHTYMPFKTLEKGYIESGLYINKLINMNLYYLGAGVFYRYGAYHLPTEKDNFSFRFSLQYAL